ncbi:hypothetical protein L1887_22710 [Cichorium endivia]|nr:hypothetical protein L1887_22710 [Cichorium endivia]
MLLTARVPGGGGNTLVKACEFISEFSSSECETNPVRIAYGKKDQIEQGKEKGFVDLLDICSHVVRHGVSHDKHVLRKTQKPINLEP